MEEWALAVQRDLTPFSDPGISINYGVVDRWLTAEWTTRGDTHSAAFTPNPDGNIQVKFAGQELSYPAFLSSSQLSDLLGLAGMMRLQRGAQLFVETKARITDNSDEEPALSLLRNSLSSAYDAITRVVFVMGEAGAGKTEVLRELVRQQADKYVRGEADSLYLYVNTQGRALARLDEALATELQDLRAKLTYHAVPSLVRNGVLVPVIDGFDELLGVSGYEDAFSSLRRFLDDLDGRGHLLASARSVYYEQEFLSRADRTSLSGKSLEIIPVSVSPWGEKEFGDYLRFRASTKFQVSADKISPASERFIESMKNIFSSQGNQLLRSKPFFVAKTADLILDGIEFHEQALVDALVHGYVERERTEKLLDKEGHPLLSARQIETVVQLICDEMWLDETRALDIASVRTIAELYAGDERLPPQTQEIVRERIPSMAFFAPGAGRERIEFEHELFFSYFLGNTIRDAVLRDAATLYSVLIRSPFPDSAPGFAAQRLREKHCSFSDVVDKASAAGNTGPRRSSQARENGGALVAAMLASGGGMREAENVIFSDLTFAGLSLGSSEIKNCALNNLEFRRTDLSEIQFVGCRAKDVTLNEVLIDPQKTKIDIEGIDLFQHVQGLRVRVPNGIERVYRPDRIAQLLHACGMPGDMGETVDAGVAPDAIALLDALMLKFEHTNIIWPEDPQHRALASQADWSELERLLLDTGIVAREARHQKGQPREALRRGFLPTQIMAGANRATVVPDEIRSFWKLMREKFPSSPAKPKS